MYGADPRLYPLGTKTGCRRVFAEAGVPTPSGPRTSTLDDVVDAVLGLHAARPRRGGAMVKLNEGVSGSGNALVDLAGLPRRPGIGRRRALRAPSRERVHGMQLEDEQVDIDAYLAVSPSGAASSRSGSSATSCAAPACSCG